MAKSKATREIQKEQQCFEKLNPQAELPEDWEDSEDSEASKKEDTKNHVMEGVRKAEDRRRRYQSPQKKQKDRAIDKRPVLVF